MVTFLPSYTDQNRLHQVEGKTLEKVEAAAQRWQILNTWRAPAKRNGNYWTDSKKHWAIKIALKLKKSRVQNTSKKRYR